VEACRGEVGSKCGKGSRRLLPAARPRTEPPLPLDALAKGTRAAPVEGAREGTRGVCFPCACACVLCVRVSSAFCVCSAFVCWLRRRLSVLPVCPSRPRTRRAALRPRAEPRPSPFARQPTNHSRQRGDTQASKHADATNTQGGPPPLLPTRLLRACIASLGLSALPLRVAETTQGDAPPPPARRANNSKGTYKATRNEQRNINTGVASAIELILSTEGVSNKLRRPVYPPNLPPFLRTALCSL
jgi:hypothetical protein